jgi:hypothetical protein
MGRKAGWKKKKIKNQPEKAAEILIENTPGKNIHLKTRLLEVPLSYLL